MMLIRESSFNKGRGMKILRGGLRKFLDTLEKIVGLGGEFPKICILQNRQKGGGGGGLLKN